MICRILQLRSRNPRIKTYTEDQLMEIKESADPTPRFSMEAEDEFSMIVLRIRTKLDRISSTPQQISDLKTKYSRSIKQAQQKQHTAQLDSIIEQNRSVFEEIKEDLGKLNTLLDYEDKEEPEYNMKRNVFISLNGVLATLIAQEKEEVESFRSCVRQKVGRQVKLIDQELDEKQVEHYIDHPQEAQKMLQNKIYGQASNNLKNAVCDIQDKLRDIQKLQRSVGQCLQLFKELELLVFAQGEIIDNIERNVNQAKDYVDRSVDVLIVAKKTHKSTKKKMYFIFCIVFIVLLVIIVPIAVKKK